MIVMWLDILRAKDRVKEMKSNEETMNCLDMSGRSLLKIA